MAALLCAVFLAVRVAFAAAFAVGVVCGVSFVAAASIFAAVVAVFACCCSGNFQQLRNQFLPVISDVLLLFGSVCVCKTCCPVIVAACFLRKEIERPEAQETCCDWPANEEGSPFHPLGPYSAGDTVLVEPFLRQLRYECARLRRPPATHIQNQHDQARATARSTNCAGPKENTPQPHCEVNRPQPLPTSASCARTGALGRRGFALESASARV